MSGVRRNLQQQKWLFLQASLFSLKRTHRSRADNRLRSNLLGMSSSSFYRSGSTNERFVLATAITHSLCSRGHFCLPALLSYLSHPQTPLFTAAQQNGCVWYVVELGIVHLKQNSNTLQLSFAMQGFRNKPKFTILGRIWQQYEQQSEWLCAPSTAS